MFEDYEDIFCQPSEAEEVIDEALGKLRELFTDNVKNTIEEAKNATEQLVGLTQRLRETEWKLKESEAKLGAAEKKFEEAELRDMPRKYIHRFVEEATGGYAPGDTVWVINKRGERRTCETCGGAKKVDAVINGKVHSCDCPTCRGYGAVTVYSDVVEQKTVQEVRLMLCFEESRANYWSTDSVFLDHCDYSTKPDRIFPTEEAARAALKGGEG